MTREKKDPRQMDLLDLIENDKLSGERREALRGILSSTQPDRSWRGQAIVPPDSLLDELVGLFERETDTPLEIPAFLTLHALAAYLLDMGVTVVIAGSIVRPDLWTTILAPSGSLKTLATSVICQVMPVRLMPETTTAARFIEELVKHNRSAWFQDEWAQVLKRIQNQSYAEEMHDYLLRLHDNKPISRRTARGSIEIADPALVIVGTTVQETFLDNVSAESMLDGFMQRFQFIMGDRDPARPPDMFPIYRVLEPAKLDPARAAWAELAAIPLHTEYRVGPDAEEAFADAFRRLFAQNREIPASFFRRIMWRTFKYAVVYHVLLNKVCAVIDPEDIGWAIRVSSMHLADARRLLDSYNLNELETLIRKAETLQGKLGRRPTKRELIGNVRGVKNGAVASFILDVMARPKQEKATPISPPSANDQEQVRSAA